MVKKQGFTLVEILVVVGILSLIIFAASSVMLTTLRSQFRTNVYIKLKQEGYFALDYMVAKIRNAQEVDPCSSSMTSLTIINPSGSSSTTTTFMILNDSVGKRIIAQEGSNQVDLTSNNFTASNLQFNCQSFEDQEVPPRITISFELQSTKIPQEKHTFQTTTALRTY